MTSPTVWPDNKRFAFTVFDDTDCATVENVAPVYAFLADCGFRTTKSVWVVEGDRNRENYIGETCENPAYLRWVLQLQAQGFEIGFHNCTWHGLPRDEIRKALEKFSELFGHNPLTAANHTGVEDSIYWADARLTGWHKLLYNLLTCFRNHNRFRGHVEGDRYFWGDLCKEKIEYFRNFVFRDVNTLKACPFLPYHDPLKPYVNNWFASSDGCDLASFNRCLSEENQDRLEAEGGACIMYTHFASGFYADGELNTRFQGLMRRLSKKNGWFVPTAVLLNHLQQARGPHVITNAQRWQLERKWLWEKIFAGST